MMPVFFDRAVSNRFDVSPNLRALTGLAEKFVYALRIVSQLPVLI